jgi:putative transposase
MRVTRTWRSTDSTVSQNFSGHQDEPWRGVDDLELATLNWVHWFNETRLHSSIGHVPPIEFEDDYYRHINPQQQPLPGEPALH